MIQARFANNKLKVDTNGTDRRYMRQFAEQNGTSESDEAILALMALCYAKLTEKSQQKAILKLKEMECK